jgi:ParB-like chromosome segregation protein Spo0J
MQFESQPRDRLSLPLSKIGERHGVVRVTDPAAISAMESSLRRYGQLSSVVVCPGQTDRFELVDGFKRLHAARRIAEVTHLQTRVLRVNVQAAKAAIVELNRLGQGLSAFEQALVVQSLYRDHGLTQAEIGVLLSRDTSWVCRRLGLVQGLAEELKQQWRLGLVKPTEARELVRLPRGKQLEALEAVRKHGLGTREVTQWVVQLLAAPAAQQARLLADPDSVLPKRHGEGLKRPDARLSRRGNSYRRSLQTLVSSCLHVCRDCSGAGLAALEPTDRLVLQQYLAPARQAAMTALSVLEAALC